VKSGIFAKKNCPETINFPRKIGRAVVLICSSYGNFHIFTLQARLLPPSVIDNVHVIASVCLSVYEQDYAKRS